MAFYKRYLFNMKPRVEDEVIDWLLVTLKRKGAASFSLYFDLEEHYGSTFARERAGFFESKLEFFKLAQRDPVDQILRLTDRGERVIKRGGWLLFVEKHRQAAHAANLKARREALAELKAAAEARISKRKSRSDGLMVPNLVVILFISFVIIFSLMYSDIHN
jgi:hypothetical protein